MSNPADLSLRCITQEIEKYLSDHPMAADTAEGVTDWWLHRKRNEATCAMVQQALDYLLDHSIIMTYTNINGNKVYLSNKN